MRELIFFILIISGISANPFPPTNYQLPEDLENQAEFKQFKFKNGIIVTEEKKILTSANDDPEYITYRLPNNTIPVRYDLWVKTLVPVEDFNFTGRVKIKIRATEETDYVTLQYRDIKIDNIDLRNVNSNSIISMNLDYEYLEPLTHEFLKIHLPNFVIKDEEFILEISYHGELHEPDNNGFYKAFYIDADGNTVWYATTKFEPHHARHLMPCYDEPAIRAPIGLQVEHDKSYNVYSNMPMKSRVSTGTDYDITEFEDTPSMQTYLLAFLVSAFKYVSNNAVDIEQRIFARPQSIDDGEANYAAEISDDILKKFEELLDFKYPLPKLDHVAITQFPSGAMENFGFITYREAGLLLFQNYTSAQNLTYRKYIARLISHEIAHQWFGNTVSPEWWTHLWLNEGFATVYEYLIPHLLYPSLNFYDEFRTSCLQASLRNDIPTNQLSVPMSYYVEDPTAIRGRFNFISYQKAGTVLMMFLEALGTEIFHQGLTIYLTANKFGVGNPSKLFNAIQLANGNGIDIKATMGSWTSQAGYPIVRVERSGNKLKFSQKRYPTGSGETYAIPLTYATKSNANFNKKTVGYWFIEKEKEVDVSEFGLKEADWIIFNNQQVGFYRVDYSNDLWLDIARGMYSELNKIHLVNRQILQEELNIGMSVSESIYASTMLEILSILEKENSYLVWNSANANIQLLNRTLFNTDVYENYMDFLQVITKPIIDKIGYERTDPNESAETTQLRLRVKAIDCYAFSNNCMEHENTKLIKYYEDENENPAPDFCLGFRLADKEIYDYYLNELITNQTLKNRNLIARTIHCTLNEDFLGVLIIAVEDNTNILTPNERINIINFMLVSSPISFNVAFEYIRRNVEEIISFRNQLISSINTQKSFDELKLLLTEALNDGILKQEDIEAIETSINGNLQWHDKHLEGVKEFFGIDETSTANGLIISFYLILAVLVATKFI